MIGTTLEIKHPSTHIDDRRHKNIVTGAEKPLGQWNTMEITCRGKEIEVKVNGYLVNQATKSQPATRGNRLAIGRHADRVSQHHINEVAGHDAAKRSTKKTVSIAGRSRDYHGGMILPQRTQRTRRKQMQPSSVYSVVN